MDPVTHKLIDQPDDCVVIHRQFSSQASALQAKEMNTDHVIPELIDMKPDEIELSLEDRFNHSQGNWTSCESLNAEGIKPQIINSSGSCNYSFTTDDDSLFPAYSMDTFLGMNDNSFPPWETMFPLEDLFQ